MTRRRQPLLLCSLALLLGLCAGTSEAFGPPRIFFTDLVSGRSGRPFRGFSRESPRTWPGPLPIFAGMGRA